LDIKKEKTMQPRENNSEDLKNIDATVSGRPDKSAEKEAWYNAFFIENHLDHYAYPDHVATPHQVKFMVYSDKEERYYPCSDRMFNAIMNRDSSDFIQEKYRQVYKRIMTVIDRQIEDEKEKDYLKSLIEIKYRHETRDEMMIPSRLEKRLLQIFLNRTHIDDPYFCEKAARNHYAERILNSSSFKKALNQVDISKLKNPPTTLTEIKERVALLELKRLLSVSVENSLWESDPSKLYTEDDYLNFFNRPIIGNGVEPLLRFLGIGDKFKKNHPKKILWLSDEAGESIIDLAIIKYLSHMGHKIIIAFKEGPIFTKVDFLDAREDEILNAKLTNAFWINDKNLSKNELIKILRSDNKIFCVADGTREHLNLMLTSKTFSRIFREVDGIISRGNDQKRRFFESHFQFTQDIFNISKDGKGAVSICYKPQHPSVIKYSHSDLEEKAKRIIDKMTEAGKSGKTVIFYSGIVGSIPGKIHVAKKVMAVFVKFFQEQSAMTFIINPSEYYEPGMDADDLMYMWEIVQRSGLIDIWRFQTYNDISQAFQIMKEKVPPEWVGKDATFSTGCTKEMKIAIEVQLKYPEMQIIGPSRENFIRRREYGLGKMYDQCLDRRFRVDRRQYDDPKYAGSERRRAIDRRSER
jgi:uncharacterized protein with ATP-grasp and redox domains